MLAKRCFLCRLCVFALCVLFEACKGGGSRGGGNEAGSGADGSAAASAAASASSWAADGSANGGNYQNGGANGGNPADHDFGGAGSDGSADPSGKLGSAQNGSAQNKTKGVFSLEVELKDGANKTLYIKELTTSQGCVPISSFTLNSSGKGSIELKIDSLSIFILSTAASNAADGASNLDTNFLVFIPSPNYGREELFIESKYSSLCQNAITRQRISTPSTALLGFEAELAKMQAWNVEKSQFWDGVKYREDLNTNQIYDSLKEKFDSLYKEAKNMAVSLSNRFTNSLLPIYVSQCALGNLPLFDPSKEEDLQKMLSYSREMKQNLEQNAHIERFSSSLEAINRRQKLFRFQKKKEECKN